MANTTTSISVFDQLNSLSQLNIVRQLGFMLIVAAGIALGTATVLWSTNSDFTPLYMDLSAQDSSDVVAALEQSGTQYKINSSNGMVTVPSNKVQEVRLQLASAGLPRSSSRGYGILEEEQSLGTSNFMEQARYNRALEQELVQTIKQIRGVRDARIHLSIPKTSSFIRNSNNPSASVMIDLISAQSVNDSQLTGIVHLVASSVAGLETENVSIIDQRGNLLSQRGNSEFNSSSENIRFTRGIEEDYNNRIMDILTPIVGAGNVRAQVSADLDFTFIETTEETYDPNTVLRSEEVNQEIAGSAGSSASVEPGSLSPIEPADSAVANVEQTQTQASAGPSRTESRRNYEVDRSVSLIRTVPGTIRQISVAVLVDLKAEEAPPELAEDGTEIINPDAAVLEQEKIDRLTQLVKDTIGFSETRGDSVNIINEQFVAAAVIPPIPELPIWQQAGFYSTAKMVSAGMVIMFLIFGVLRPALNSVVSNQNALPGKGKRRLPASSTDLANLSEIDAPDALPAPVAIPARSLYDENLAAAQNLVENEPSRAARQIQNWLANE